MSDATAWPAAVYEKANCPTCNTIGEAGDGRRCWNCQGRGWVTYRVLNAERICSLPGARTPVG